MTVTDDTERALQSFLEVTRAPSLTESGDTEHALRSFLKIARAPSTEEAIALAAVRQDKAITKLNSGVADLVAGSSSLYWLTWGLIGLTVVLTACTCALVWLTYKLASAV